MKGSAKIRYLKVVVAYCIGMITLATIASYISAWFMVDTSSLLSLVCAVFGGELLLTMVVKIMGGKAESKSETTKTASTIWTVPKVVTKSQDGDWG